MKSHFEVCQPRNHRLPKTYFGVSDLYGWKAGEYQEYLALHMVSS